MMSVLFGQFGNSLTATTYLTTQIGSGTTNVQEIASGNFTVPNSSSILQTVLTVSSLSVGTYHLVIVPTGIATGVGNWLDTSSPTITSDTGVTFRGYTFATFATVAANYGPASPFGMEFVSHPEQFTITGTPGICICP